MPPMKIQRQDVGNRIVRVYVDNVRFNVGSLAGKIPATAVDDLPLE